MEMHNFYRYNGDIKSLYEWLFKLRVLHEKLLVSKLKQYDYSNLKEPGKQYLAEYKNFKVFNTILTLLKEDTEAQASTYFNIDSSVMIYLVDDEIYVQFFNVNPDMLVVYEETNMITDCFYDDNLKGNSDLPDEEIDRRSQLVAKIAARDPHDWIRGRCGLQFPLTCKADAYTIARRVLKEQVQ